MSEAQCIRYPIKPGQREALVNWTAKLKGRSTEVAEAFAEAGLVAETVFLEKSDNGHHMLIYTSAENLQASNQALASSRLPLVREFNQLMTEAVDIENAVSLELVFHTP
jgi:hypothetical protein